MQRVRDFKTHRIYDNMQGKPRIFLKIKDVDDFNRNVTKDGDREFHNLVEGVAKHYFNMVSHVETVGTDTPLEGKRVERDEHGILTIHRGARPACFTPAFGDNNDERPDSSSNNRQVCGG